MPFNTECNRLSLFFRAFSNRLRLEIICTLRNGEKSVTQITDAVGASKHNVSQQLKFLREIKMLNQRKSGRNIFYSLCNPEVVTILETLLTQLSEDSYKEWLQNLSEIKS